MISYECRTCGLDLAPPCKITTIDDMAQGPKPKGCPWDIDKAKWYKVRKTRKKTNEDV